MMKGDRMSTHHYSFVECMDPENIIKENRNIPCFVFKYFIQKDISDLIDETPAGKKYACLL